MPWAENVSNILFISLTVCHNDVQSDVPVGYIMISIYCWHSNVNKSFEIKIASEQNVNSLKTFGFKGRSSMGPHYAKAAFMKTILFLKGNHTFHETFLTLEKMLLIYHENLYNYLKIHQIKKHTCKTTTWKNFHDFLTPKLLQPKLELNWFLGYPNQT